MSLESVIASLLAVAPITAVVGDRIALEELPEESGYPSLVYEMPAGVPVHPINASSGPQLMVSRVQVTALATSVQQVIDMHALVRAALEFQSGVIAGVRVTAIVRVLVGPWVKDTAAKVFGRPVDYEVTFYDA